MDDIIILISLSALQFSGRTLPGLLAVLRRHLRFYFQATLISISHDEYDGPRLNCGHENRYVSWLWRSCTSVDRLIETSMQDISSAAIRRSRHEHNAATVASVSTITFADLNLGEGH